MQILRLRTPINFVPREFSSASGESGSRNQIKIKTGPGVEKRCQIFSGGNNEAHIVFLTICNTFIQDKGLKPVTKGWTGKVETTQDELEYHELDKPANSLRLSAQPNLSKKKNRVSQLHCSFKNILLMALSIDGDRAASEVCPSCLSFFKQECPP